MTEYRVALPTDEAMLRRAMRVYVWRRHFCRPRTAAAYVIAFVVSAFMINGEGFTFLSGVISATMTLLVLFLLAAWRAQVVALVDRHRRMDPPGIELILREQGMTISSSLNVVTIPWSQFSETWALPGFWMLFTASSQFTAVPTATIPPDMLAFLRARVPRAVTV